MRIKVKIDDVEVIVEQDKITISTIDGYVRMTNEVVIPTLEAATTKAKELYESK